MRGFFLRDKTFLPALAAALALNACMAGESESHCGAAPPPPPAIALDPDSLVLVPTSGSDHVSDSGGRFADYYRSFRMTISPSIDEPAFPHFDSSGLSLFADGIRIRTPPFQLQNNGGQCPAAYWGMTSADIMGRGADTAFTLEVRKQGASVRSWKMEYAFDSTELPEFRIAPTADGLAATISVKPGAEADYVWFGGGEAPYVALPFQRTGDTLRADIVFKDIDFMRARADSAVINHAFYDVCMNTRSGYESLKLDGVSLPAYARFCWGLPGESRGKILAYRKPYCRDCR